MHGTPQAIASKYESETFFFRKKELKVTDGIQLFHPVLVSEEQHLILQAVFFDKLPSDALFRPVADKQELRLCFGCDITENADDIFNTFYFSEVRNMDDDFSSGKMPCFSFILSVFFLR